ncbi:MAG TPA: hypothetical protein DCL21_02420 [Alphaproteobacteria bacterium]|nr:hypothetical protein [Alphaproteobacteria bacterium]
MKVFNTFCLIATCCFSAFVKAGDITVAYEYVAWDADVAFSLDANGDGVVSINEDLDYHPESEFHVVSFDYIYRFDNLSFLLNFKKAIDDSDLEGFYNFNGNKIFNVIDDTGDYKRFGIGIGYYNSESSRGGLELIYSDVDFDDSVLGGSAAKVEDLGVNLYQDYWISHKKFTLGLLFGTAITRTKLDSSLLTVSQRLEAVSLALYVEPYFAYEIATDLSLMFKAGYWYQGDITDEFSSSSTGASDFGQIEQSFANFELGLNYKF